MSKSGCDTTHSKRNFVKSLHRKKRKGFWFCFILEPHGIPIHNNASPNQCSTIVWFPFVWQNPFLWKRSIWSLFRLPIVTVARDRRTKEFLYFLSSFTYSFAIGNVIFYLLFRFVLYNFEINDLLAPFGNMNCCLCVLQFNREQRRRKNGRSRCYDHWCRHLILRIEYSKPSVWSIKSFRFKLIVRWNVYWR